ncbi:MAG: hypothetical protein LBP35_00475 [Candidatus Ancillula trichonymphae]|nr:hypothetical protein [Candidatus Ancillula trichonymphae]
MVDKDIPVFVILPPLSRPQLHSKVISNIQEIKAREVPRCSRLRTPMMLRRTHMLLLRGPPSYLQFVNFAARCNSSADFCVFTSNIPKGLDVDKPRNLAKSVMVE